MQNQPFYHIYRHCILIFSFRSDVWKLQNFSVNQILREIKVCRSRESQNLQFNTLRSSEFWDLWLFPLIEGWNLPKWQKSEPPKMAKITVFQLPNSPKLISRKIWVIEKSWNFHTFLIYLIRCNQHVLFSESVSLDCLWTLCRLTSDATL